MIHVLATITVNPGKREEFLAIFRANVPAVRQEDGCIEYVPAVDADTGLPVQQMDENIVTVIEKWRDLQALQAHLKAPHMLAYREQVRELVAGTSVKVLREA